MCLYLYISIYISKALCVIVLTSFFLFTFFHGLCAYGIGLKVVRYSWLTVPLGLAEHCGLKILKAGAPVPGTFLPHQTTVHVA